MGKGRQSGAGSTLAGRVCVDGRHGCHGGRLVRYVRYVREAGQGVFGQTARQMGCFGRAEEGRGDQVGGWVPEAVVVAGYGGPGRHGMA